MSETLRGRIAIAGIGNTKRWDAPGRSPFDQLQEAAILALEDCGLGLADVDGLYCALSSSGLPVLNVAERLGLGQGLRQADGTMVGGASFLFHLQSASAALDAGLCDVALVCYGSNQRSAGGSLVSMPDPQPYETPYRARYPASSYALAAARHMHEYGTTRENLADVAVAARNWARLNPDAFEHGPLAREEILASRMIWDPLTRADCCLVTDGGAAVVVTRADRASDRRPLPPTFWGPGWRSPTGRYSMPDLTTTAAVRSGGPPTRWPEPRRRDRSSHGLRRLHDHNPDVPGGPRLLRQGRRRCIRLLRRDRTGRQLRSTQTAADCRATIPACTGCSRSSKRSSSFAAAPAPARLTARMSRWPMATEASCPARRQRYWGREPL